MPMVGITKIVKKYSIHEDMWACIKDLPEIQSDSAHRIVGGRIVVTGGLGGEKLKAMATGECIGYPGKCWNYLVGPLLANCLLLYVSH